MKDIIYVVVYRKKETNSQQLPYTGSRSLLAGLGLATASLAVLLVSKKHRSKVLGILLISSIGVSNFVPLLPLHLKIKSYFRITKLFLHLPMKVWLKV